MSPDVHIRFAAEDEHRAIGDIEVAARRHAYARLVEPEMLASMTTGNAQAWQDRLRADSRTHRMLVAESGGEVIGFCYVGPSSQSDAGDLHALHVLPAWHGTGVADELHAAALAVLVDMGYDRQLLWVLDGNARAIAFYRRHGWRPDGETSSDGSCRYSRYVRDTG